jgi:DNA-binding transcriptional LysR family regulator
LIDPLLRLSLVWTWIPAFRVVAELQHLPSAAERLHVSPSALSRSIQLLQNRLGVRLFERRGRNLRLNDQGELLLAEVRRAMRLLDDGMARAQRTELSGKLRVMGSGPFASLLLLPAIAELRRRSPGLVPEVLPGAPNLAVPQLLAGALDLVIGISATPHPELETLALLDFDYGVYCGEGHPLHRQRKVSPADLLAHDFAGPPEGESDGWPPQVHRRVGVRLGQLRLGLELCAIGGCLALLPVPIAESYLGPGSLRRLPFPGLPKGKLFATRRRPLKDQDKVDGLLQEVLRVAKGLTPERVPSRTQVPPGPRRPVPRETPPERTKAKASVAGKSRGRIRSRGTTIIKPEKL